MCMHVYVYIYIYMCAYLSICTYKYVYLSDVLYPAVNGAASTLLAVCDVQPAKTHFSRAESCGILVGFA